MFFYTFLLYVSTNIYNIDSTIYQNSGTIILQIAWKFDRLHPILALFTPTPHFLRTIYNFSNKCLSIFSNATQSASALWDFTALHMIVQIDQWKSLWLGLLCLCFLLFSISVHLFLSWNIALIPIWESAHKFSEPKCFSNSAINRGKSWFSPFWATKKIGVGHLSYRYIQNVNLFKTLGSKASSWKHNSCLFLFLRLLWIVRFNSLIFSMFTARYLRNSWSSRTLQASGLQIKVS